MKRAQNRRCTFQYVNNHEAKFEWKGIKTFGVTDYTNLVPLKCCGGPNVLSSTPLKNEKKKTKRAQNRRCTSLICEQSLGKIWMKRNKNFWSYRLHQLGSLKVLRTDKCLSSTPLKNEKKLWNVHKIEGAHLQYVSNHLAKFEWKRTKTFGVTDYTNLVPLKCCGRTDGVDPLLGLLSLKRRK